MPSEESNELELQRGETIQRRSVAILEMTREQTGDLVDLVEEESVATETGGPADQGSTQAALVPNQRSNEEPEDPSPDNDDTLAPEDIVTDYDIKAKSKQSLEDQDRLTKEKARRDAETALKSGLAAPGAVSDPNPPKGLDYRQSTGNATGKPSLGSSTGTRTSEESNFSNSDNALGSNTDSRSTQLTDTLHEPSTIASTSDVPVEARAITAGDLEEEVRERLKQDAVNAELVEGEKSSKFVYIVMAITLLLVVGAVVGVAVAFSGGSDDDGVDSSSAFPDLITDEPTGAPTSTPLTEEQQALLVLLEEQSGEEALAPRDDATPQFQAFSWMGDHGFVLDENKSNEKQLLQLYALVTLYYATTLEQDWEGRAGWLDASVPVCDWYPGDLCDPFADPAEERRGRALEGGKLSDLSIRKLNLSKNGLRGELPAEIGLLTDLEYLNLSENRIFGSIPNFEWSSFANLIVFDIHDNMLVSTFLSESWTAMESLEVFNIANNAIAGDFPEDLSAVLPVIRELNLSGNSFSGSIPTILPESLEVLNLQDADIKGDVPSTLWSLPALKELLIGQNVGLNGAVPESAFTKSGFETLNIAGLGWAGLFPVEMTLKSLDLSGNSYGLTFPTSLARWQSLVSLRLDDMGLSGPIPDEIFELSNLVELSISFNAEVTGVIPNNGWEQLPKLQVLQLRSLSLTGNIPPEFCAALTNLMVLELDQNMLGGPLPSQLGDLSSLTQLNLSENGFEGEIPPSVQNLANLQVFQASNNILSGEIPFEFFAADALVVLDLSNNSFNGTLPEAASSFSNLEVFDISENDLSGELPDQLSAWTDLRLFNVSYNAFTGRISTEFSTWLAIETIGVQGNDFFCEIPKPVCDMVRTPRGTAPLSFAADCNNVDEEGNNALFCPCCTLCCTSGEDCEAPSRGGGGAPAGGRPAGGAPAGGPPAGGAPAGGPPAGGPNGGPSGTDRNGPPACALRPGGAPGGGQGADQSNRPLTGQQQPVGGGGSGGPPPTGNQQPPSSGTGQQVSPSGPPPGENRQLRTRTI